MGVAGGVAVAYSSHNNNIEGSTTTVVGCTFSSNHVSDNVSITLPAAASGGVAVAYYASDTVSSAHYITNCSVADTVVVASNAASGVAGGVAVGYSSRNNEGNIEGSTTAVAGCTFSTNHVSGNAVAVSGGAAVAYYASIIVGNAALGDVVCAANNAGGEVCNGHPPGHRNSTETVGDGP